MTAVELFAGAGYETAATPDSTLDPALPDAVAVRAALAGRFAIGDGWRLGVGVTDVQTSRETTPAEASWPTTTSSCQPDALTVVADTRCG